MICWKWSHALVSTAMIRVMWMEWVAAVTSVAGCRMPCLSLLKPSKTDARSSRACWSLNPKPSTPNPGHSCIFYRCSKPRGSKLSLCRRSPRNFTIIKPPSNIKYSHCVVYADVLGSLSCFLSDLFSTDDQCRTL